MGFLRFFHVPRAQFGLPGDDHSPHKNAGCRGLPDGYGPHIKVPLASGGFVQWRAPQEMGMGQRGGEESNTREHNHLAPSL